MQWRNIKARKFFVNSFTLLYSFSFHLDIKINNSTPNWISKLFFLSSSSFCKDLLSLYLTELILKIIKNENIKKCYEVTCQNGFPVVLVSTKVIFIPPKKRFEKKIFHLKFRHSQIGSYYIVLCYGCNAPFTCVIQS